MSEIPLGPWEPCQISDAGYVAPTKKEAKTVKQKLVALREMCARMNSTGEKFGNLIVTCEIKEVHVE